MDLVPSRLVEKSELRNQGKLPSLGSMVRLCLAGWNALMARCFLAGLNWCSKNGVPLKSSGWSSISWLKLTFWDIKHPGMAHCWSEKAIMLHFRTRVGVGQVPKKIEAPTTIGPLKVLRGYPRPRRDGLMEGLSFAGRGPKGWVPDVLGIVQTILPTWDIAMICLTERERGREGERERGREKMNSLLMAEWCFAASQLHISCLSFDVRKTHPASLKHQHGEITSPYFTEVTILFFV